MKNGIQKLTQKGTMIAPSLLAADFGHLADEIAKVEAAGADMLHCDIILCKIIG